jgi:pyruvate dehydrogenase phosphatase
MSELNQEPLQLKFRLPEPFHKPILSPELEILVRKLQPGDQILIFASDGLWEHLSNQEAVDIVQSFPRSVSSHSQCHYV